MAKRGAEIDGAPLSRFGVLVAQLDSIAAAARQQPPDPLLCFDLLSELVSAIEEEPKESIQQCQRKCEDVLYSLLVLGACRPVRRLASSAMGRVIGKGDAISIYSRVSSLQGWLVDCKRSEPQACSGASLCLGELYRLFGRKITSGLVETANIATKLMKFHEDFVRQDALQMLEKALEGSAGSGAPTAYSEAFRIITRVGVSDKSFIVRLAAARCLKTFASIGGPGLGFTELENSILQCTKALEDPVSSVRDAFAEALGALLALAMNPEAQVKQRGRNHPVPAKKLEDSIQKHLILPFIRASGARAKDLRIGMALSWVFFLQVVRLKYRLPDSELQKFSLQAMDLLQGNSTADAHALACVLYILRVGVTDQMTEPTQRSFLVLLGRKLESADYSPLVGIATLRVLSYLLKTLGEVPVELRNVLDNTVVEALSHSSLHVRIEAALTLRVLAEVDPTCVGGLISYGVTTLHALRESVASEKGSHMGLQLDSLHGQATALAAIVFISPKLLLGYPARLPKSVFEVSKKMLTEFSRSHVAATVEKEAGWLLLSSLVSSMPKKELEDQVFDVLLLWADPFVGDPETHIRQTHDLTAEIRVLSAAIEALTAFIKTFVYPTLPTTDGGILLQPILAYLRGALHYISSLAARPLQNLKPALDLFIIRTLMAYQSISDPMSYKSEHSQIMQICSTPFSDPSGSEESSCLRVLLDRRDACLGPWIPGRDWFEDELRAFEGDRDGLMPCVWEEELSSFPQPEPISKLLINQKLLCFSTMFATQDNEGKIILLNKIDQCLKSGKRQSWHVSSVTNACVALLAGLKAVLVLRPQTLGVQILTSMQSIFQGILAEGDICPSQRRASSEGLGLLARVGNDIFTARMTRSLLGELVAATEPIYIGSIALSLGCIHRSAGGMALSTLVPATVSSISLLAKSSNASLQLWALHALLLTIEAAGLSYVPQVQGTLFLAMEILLSEENGLADLRQEIGRLINAIVAVLGPELAPGSTFFSRCKSVIAEISSCQEMSTLLESIRFTQQLVLFAPQAVSVHSHVQNLLPTLSSKQPALRNLAVSTLRHLIEKDPVAMIHESIEENLFSMLNEETDPEIVSLVRTTITRLLYTSCPSCPSRWLAIFHNMILATSTRRNASEKHINSENDHINASSEGGGRMYYGEDDEDMIASANGEQKHASGSAFSINSTRDKHLRYRTRFFAAECLSYLPTAVGAEPSHFDLSLARIQRKGQTSSGDWLVLHLQELIALSYQISTSQFEGMQPIGVSLLILIIDKFESIPDPDLPEHLLLEQYQAQLVSAVRSAVSMSSGPLLLEAGLQLATKILTGSIITGDRVALNRMFSLISRPLSDIKDLYYPSFAEWVACKIKVRLLAAHASIKCYVYQLIREEKGVPEEYLQLTPLLSSSSSILGKYWISVLKDYIYICFGLHLKFSYKPFLDGIQSPLVSSKVQNCLEEAWPMIVQAIALDAVPANFEMDNSCSSNIEDPPKSLFVSGYSMVRLESLEFQFLWGLALLLLFQGHQLVVGTQLKISLVHRLKENNGGQLFEERTNIIMGHILLPVVQSLSTEAFFSHQYLTLDLCTELLQVLIFADVVEDSWNSLIITLLSQIVHFCPDGFFEAEDFTTAATELYFKYLLVAFQSYNAIPQVDPNCENLLSKLSMIAESIACRLKQKKTRRMLIMAHVSICYELFTRASSNISLSKVITFLQRMMPFLKKYFREAGIAIDDYSPPETVLGVWTSMLASVSQDCIKRISILENRTSDSGKLLEEMLALCLEEAVSLARLVHETKQFRQKKDKDILLFTVFKHCTRCIRDTLNNTNIQVRIVGLRVLKSIAQRELTQGSHMKDHDFSLFLIGEFFGDIFRLIQHTLKGRISRESVALMEECLRLLFLSTTLSQTSDSLQAIMRLLLEALLMVFSVSNESQEINDVKNISRRLVSHLIQIPSFAMEIKGIMLSMPVSQIQQLQDMVRASVSQGQVLTQTNFDMRSQSTATEIHQLDVAANADSRSLKEEHDTFDNEDDDEDWDAFQSLPANEASDSHVDIPKVSEDENSVLKVETSADKERLQLEENEDMSLNIQDLENDKCELEKVSVSHGSEGEEYAFQSLPANEASGSHVDIPKVSEDESSVPKVETSADKERLQLEENEVKSLNIQDPEYDKCEVEKVSVYHRSEGEETIEEKDDGGCKEFSDPQGQINDVASSPSDGESSVVEISDHGETIAHHHDLPFKDSKNVNSELNMGTSTENERTSPDRNELMETSDPQHFHGKEIEIDESVDPLHSSSASAVETSDHGETTAYHHDLPLLEDSENVDTELNIDTSTENERTIPGRNEIEEVSDPQHFHGEESDVKELVDPPHSSSASAGECSAVDSSSDSVCQSSAVETSDYGETITPLPDLPSLKDSKNVSSELNIDASTQNERTSPDRNELREASNPQHFQAKEVEYEESVDPLHSKTDVSGKEVEYEESVDPIHSKADGSGKEVEYEESVDPLHSKADGSGKEVEYEESVDPIHSKADVSGKEVEYEESVDPIHSKADVSGDPLQSKADGSEV